MSVDVKGLIDRAKSDPQATVKFEKNGYDREIAIEDGEETVFSSGIGIFMNVEELLVKLDSNFGKSENLPTIEGILDKKKWKFLVDGRSCYVMLHIKQTDCHCLFLRTPVSEEAMEAFPDVDLDISDQVIDFIKKFSQMAINNQTYIPNKNLPIASYFPTPCSNTRVVVGPFGSRFFHDYICNDWN